jgi:hypothetical protein
MWDFLLPDDFQCRRDWHQYYTPQSRGWVLTAFDRRLLRTLRIACD